MNITPLMTLTVDEDAGRRQHNYYGWKQVHILAFNYDGKGTALVAHDDAQEIETLGGEDLDAVLCGDPGTGVRWYRPSGNR